MKEKLVSLAQLTAIAEKLRKEGKKLAATSGCFDILHAGHVSYLGEARAKADALAVMLNSDSSVRRLKGSERPIVPEKERAIVLAALACVDYVCLFAEDTPCNAYLQFKPDIIIKGGDYAGKHIPEMDAAVQYGGAVEYVSLVAGCSSTNIIEKIKNIVVQGSVYKR